MERDRARPESNGLRLQLLRNILWNLAGHGLPLVAALWAVPLILDGLGQSRFGFLGIVWALVGYIGLFDLGVSRSLTQQVADRIAKTDTLGIGSLFRTASMLSLCLGGLSGLIVAAFAEPFAHDWLKVPAEQAAETHVALYWLAGLFPLVTVGACMRGLLEAHQHFLAVGGLRLLSGLLDLAAPLLAVWLAPALPNVLALMLVGRVLVLALSLVACRHYQPALLAYGGFEWQAVRRLLVLGGWVSVSNLISPVLVYLDRILIGILVSTAAVALYVIPFELVTRLLALPGAAMGVLYPAFARLLAADRGRAFQLFRESGYLLGAVLLLATLLLSGISRSFMQWWLGDTLAADSVAIMRVLVIGVFVNGMAHLAFNYLQAAGRPDITAKAHMLELVVHVPLLLILLERHGPLGAAVAWSARVMLDFLLLARAAQVLHAAAGLRVSGYVGLTLAGSLALLACALWQP